MTSFSCFAQCLTQTYNTFRRSGERISQQIVKQLVPSGLRSSKCSGEIGNQHDHCYAKAQGYTTVRIKRPDTLIFCDNS